MAACAATWAATLALSVLCMPGTAATASVAPTGSTAPTGPASPVRGPGSATTAGAAGGVRLTDPRITESSGLALSRAHPHTVWTVNDSGDSARVFAVDTRTGRTVGVHTFDAPVRDVEALAVTPSGRMLVADIGDNSRTRELVRVFWFDEPALGDTSGPWASWELMYPDGPHDAEALAVHPVSGRIHLVTKASDGSAAVYALPAEPTRRGRNRLTRVAPAPALVTDAVYLSDGSGLAVRTYTVLQLLDPATWRPTARLPLPVQPQGETVALAPGGRDLLVGSEGVRSLLLPVAVPPGTRSTGAPTTTATTTSSATTTTATTTTATTTTATTAAAERTATADGTATADRTVRADGRQVALGLGGSALLVALAVLTVRLARRSRAR